MPTLAEVSALAGAHHARQVKFNIETKVEAGAPEQTAPREVADLYCASQLNCRVPSWHL
jgi:hypothetical protein